jgi:hypothetical protein
MAFEIEPGSGLIAKDVYGSKHVVFKDGKIVGTGDDPGLLALKHGEGAHVVTTDSLDIGPHGCASEMPIPISVRPLIPSA